MKATAAFVTALVVLALGLAAIVATLIVVVGVYNGLRSIQDSHQPAQLTRDEAGALTELVQRSFDAFMSGTSRFTLAEVMALAGAVDAGARKPVRQLLRSLLSAMPERERQKWLARLPGSVC